MGTHVKTDARQESYTSPRWDVAALVPRTARRILELGCSTGATAEVLKQRQPCQYVGIEMEEPFAERARRVIDEVICADLNGDRWMRSVSGEFDCVIAADVLEHLIDPWNVLRAVTRRVAARGCVVVSLPNVRHLQTVVALARRRWPYRERGTHDATHLRFFTFREMRGLCAVAGLRIETVRRNYRVFDSGSRLDRLAPMAAWLGLRDLLTYQYVLRGVPDPRPEPPPPESVPLWARDWGLESPLPKSRP